MISESSKNLCGIGLTQVGKISWGSSDVEELLKIAEEEEGCIRTNTGALACFTGEYTGRCPQDKFIVRDKTTEAHVAWGPVNQPISAEHFARLRSDQAAYLRDQRVFVRDAFGGSDPRYRLPIRLVTQYAWASIFAKHLFLRPTEDEIANHHPEFSIIHTPLFCATPELHGTRSGTFIALDFTERVVLIGGTSYAGEIKKSIFTVLNFLLPLKGVLAMHCSANVSVKDPKNVAIFFGLSGTGKTTISADPHRQLIGDDEHGWSDHGVFNFEGGCYAKCINLSAEQEPQIFSALRDSAILENVVVDSKTRIPNFADNSLTENTRGAYPLNYIPGAVPTAMGGHPRNVIFLTCDAFGVMPPIAKLTPEQAMYHFLSGYTAKVAGTEKGMGKSPQATFSACFGSPFLPLAPVVYAEMLGKRIQQHHAQCWLINTGWVGGPYGVGNRIRLAYTRAMVEAALEGKLHATSTQRDAIFGFEIPTQIPDVPSSMLHARGLWSDGAAYDAQARKLSELFIENFKKFDARTQALSAFGPKL